MKKKLIIIFILLFSFIPSLVAQEYANFLILENPQVYSILNKYEQSLTSSEKELFRPFSPLQIVSKDHTLGDGVTSALKFRFYQDTYFLLKDDDDNLVGDNKNPYSQVFGKCRIIEDTIRVIRNKAILLSQKYPANGVRIYLKRDDRIVRLFKYKDYYCVKCLGQKIKYGWCSFSDKRAWRDEIQVKRIDKNLKSELQERIITRIDAANKIYKHYFDSFNSITSKQKSIPQWRCAYNDDILRCTLTNPYKDSGLLEESTQYIIRDLENIVIGKPFEVHYQKGEITIQLKD